jgi:hypothetical protein
MSRSYKRIRRDNERAFPHQVRLPRARLWRMDHVDAQLATYSRGNGHGGTKATNCGAMTLDLGFQMPSAGSGVAGLVNALRHRFGAFRPNSRPIGHRRHRKTSGNFTGQST